MARGDPVRHVVTFAADPASLDAVHEALDVVWRGAPVPDRDRHLFATAVGEIAANVLTHAGAGARVELVLEADGGSLRATFVDDGRAVDAAVLEAPMPDDDATSGRGIPMARAASDELRYERLDGRNRWLVVRRFGP